jgi:putative transcription antitermination factor YqgF
MKILGIDYGRSKMGLALADGSLAEPLKVIRYKNMKELVRRIEIEIEKNGVEKIVVGISEGEMGEESKKFAEKIGAVTFDETLSTQEAQILSREAGIHQKKRHEMEDAYAAAIMLQNYLDSN